MGLTINKKTTITIHLIFTFIMLFSFITNNDMGVTMYSNSVKQILKQIQISLTIKFNITVIVIRKLLL